MPNEQILSPEIKLAYGECERRLRSVRTDFISATRSMENAERRNAIFAAYVSLRVLGPLALHPPHRATNPQAVDEALDAWLAAAERCHAGNPDPSRPDQVALAHAMERFSLPLDGWRHLAEGLREVARGDEVPNLGAYIRQGRLLSVSNTGVFMHIVVAKEGHRRFHAPAVDIEELAYNPGLFAYTVRVMLDILEQPARGPEPRTSIPRELLALHGLDVNNLLEFRALAYAPREFFEMMNDLGSLAREFYQNGVTKLTQAASCLTPEAVRHVDYALRQYRATLHAMEEQKFAPAELERLRGERGWRHGAHRTSAAAVTDNESSSASPPS